MYSIAFPKMFTNSTTILYQDREATLSNLKLTLLSEKTSLFGDPYFGTKLRQVIFSQNSPTLKDIVIDDIYTAVLIFVPQLKLSRNDIKVKSSDDFLFCEFVATNLIDYTVDLYQIKLTEDTSV